MKDYFDVKFSELLQKSEFELPNSYEMRFQNTLEKISAKKAKRYFLLFHSKVAAVIALCVVSLYLSIAPCPSDASINSGFPRVEIISLSCFLARIESSQISIFKLSIVISKAPLKIVYVYFTLKKLNYQSLNVTFLLFVKTDKNTYYKFVK